MKAGDETQDILCDMLFVLAVAGTEAIQTTENTSALLRGSVPESCVAAHHRLRREIVSILEKHGHPGAEALREHLFGHEDTGT